MVNQTEDQNRKSSEDIERLMRDPLRTHIEVWLANALWLIEGHLGFTADDLHNEIRIEIWKALLSYDPSKSSIKTYCKRVIDNMFVSFLRQCSIPKYRSLEYMDDPDPSNLAAAEARNMVTEDTGETFYQRRQELQRDLMFLDQVDSRLLQALVEGKTLGEMRKETGKTRVEIIHDLNRIQSLVNYRRSFD